MPPIPIVIDTDIGADPDDAMALAFAVASPEVDVLGVTVVDGDVELRARMAARILGVAGRADIPVFLGERQPMGPGRGPTILGFEGRGLLDLPYSGPESLIDPAPAVSWLATLAQRQPYHLVAIGPLTNVATALRSHATLAGDLLGLTVMGGVFNESLLPEGSQKDIRQRGLRVAWPGHNTASDPCRVNVRPLRYSDYVDHQRNHVRRAASPLHAAIPPRIILGHSSTARDG